MSRLTVRFGAVVSLVLGTLVLAFGVMMLLASFLAIGSEDEVPVSWYVVPLAAGTLPWIGLYFIWVRRQIRRLQEEPEPDW